MSVPASLLRRGRASARARGVIVAAGALGHQSPAAALSAEWVAAQDLGARTGGPDQQRIDPRRCSLPRDPGTTSRAGRDQLEHPRGCDDPHRDRDLRGGWRFARCRCFSLMVEAGRRGTQPLHFLMAVLRQPRAAVRVLRFRGTARRGLGLPPGDADTRELDHDQGEAQASARRGAADHRTGPSAPEPRQDPGGLRGRALVCQAQPEATPLQLPDRSRRSQSRPPLTSSEAR